jgi:endoglucanase
MKTVWTLPAFFGIALAACASPNSGGGGGGGSSSTGEAGTTGGGRAGTSGAAGASGAAGTRGASGTAGVAGPAGTTGAAGTSGVGGTGAAGRAGGGNGGGGNTNGSGNGGTTGSAGTGVAGRGGGGGGSGGSSASTGGAGTGGAAGGGGAGAGGGTAGRGGNGGTTGSAGAGGSANASGVHVVGSQIYDGTKVIRLMGVDRPGAEYSCINGPNVFDPADGSGNNMATITAMLAWKINAVRIPLNEDCWLSLNGVSAKASGAAYQSAILTWVNLLLQNGIYPILDLHWTENNGAKATGQQPMPDAAHAADFWSSVAAAYANSPKVIFDLFNEPYPDNNTDGGWACWKSGGTCPGVAYQVAGMQSLVTAVRTAGANNLILVAGIEYANDLSQWLQNEPSDPANNLAVSWHVYPNSNYTGSHTLSMDASDVAGIVPIVATEIGDANCTSGSTDTNPYITMTMAYLDGLNPPQSYVAWSWSTDDQPILISNYDGTATCGGATYKAHLLATPH